MVTGSFGPREHERWFHTGIDIGCNGQCSNPFINDNDFLEVIDIAGTGSDTRVVCKLMDGKDHPEIEWVVYWHVEPGDDLERYDVIPPFTYMDLTLMQMSPIHLHFDVFTDDVPDADDFNTRLEYAKNPIELLPHPSAAYEDWVYDGDFDDFEFYDSPIQMTKNESQLIYPDSWPSDQRKIIDVTFMNDPDYNNYQCIKVTTK